MFVSLPLLSILLVFLVPEKTIFLLCTFLLTLVGTTRVLSMSQRGEKIKRAVEKQHKLKLKLELQKLSKKKKVLSKRRESVYI